MADQAENDRIAALEARLAALEEWAGEIKAARRDFSEALAGLNELARKDKSRITLESLSRKQR